MAELSPHQFLVSRAPFDSLPEQQLRQFADNCSMRKLSNREYLFIEGEECRACYYVVEGRVALLKCSHGAKELMVALFPEGEPFAVMPAIQKNPFPVSARAEGSTKVLSVPGKELIALWDEYPEVRDVCMSYVSSRMSRILELARSLAHDSADVRLAAILLSLLPQDGRDDGVEIQILRRDLSDLGGTTIETASRITKRMEAQGVLDLSTHGVVKILDVEGLANMTIPE